MYTKTFTIPLVSLILILFSSFIARAQTYVPCNDISLDVFAGASGVDSDTDSHTFTLTTGRNVSIRYGYEFSINARGMARICLYNSSGATTPFGCQIGREGWTTTTFFLPPGTYTLEAYVNSTETRGYDLSEIWASATLTASKVAPTIFNITGGGAACSGGTASIPIGLSGSDAGLTHQLLRNGAAVANYTSTSGGAFTFGSYNTPGTYTVTTIALAL